MNLPDIPFVFLDALELAELQESAYTQKRNQIQADGCKYNFWVHRPDGREFLILQYAGEDSDVTDVEDMPLPPDDVWQRIMLLPPLGLGTELITSDLMAVPLCVVNNDNVDDLLEIHNDGIVSFEVGNTDTGKQLLAWVRSKNCKDFFVTLGSYVIEGHHKAIARGGAHFYLQNKKHK